MGLTKHIVFLYEILKTKNELKNYVGVHVCIDVRC